MPNEAAGILIAISALIVFVAGAALVPVLRDLWVERKETAPGWDETQELTAWRQEEERKRLTCTYCDGTRCWDWRRNQRECGQNPTEAAMAPTLIGAHNPFTDQQTVPGWWPLPKTLSGRKNPDLWRKVADHCQVALTRPRAMALP